MSSGPRGFLHSFSIQPVRGSAIEPHLPEVAALRIEVFREFPYLYEGSLDYESQYLRSYAASPRSVVVLARDKETIVGAATAMPALEHGETEVADALRSGGFDPANVFYFGESVLRASHRGRGIGHAFFDAREACARELGFSIAAFCAVVREPSHPLRPHDYTPHDVFWHKRGFTERRDIQAHFAWRDIEEPAETAKPMVFWVKDLTP
jgi:GNAT superfamily N-acetyltransferase